MKQVITNFLKRVCSNKFYVDIYDKGSLFNIEVKGVPSYVNESAIYNLLLEEYFTINNETNLVSVSEFIDEGQGWRNTREKVDELKNRFSLQTRITRDFDSLETILPIEKEFIVHLTGTIQMDWISQILAYSGTNLPNIVYGLKSNLDPWMETIVEWNKLFVKWFFLKSPDSEFAILLNQVTFICYGSDDYLELIFTDEHKMNLMYKFIEKLAIDQKWNLVVVDHFIK
jgi:hypothetical protein